MKIDINYRDELKRMSSADLYALQYTVETLLKDIYDEEYHRKLLIKYRIESTQKVLEEALEVLDATNAND